VPLPQVCRRLTDDTPSLPKTLSRWESTTFGLVNRWAAKLPDRCGSCPTSGFGSGRDPQGVRLIAFAVQLEHAVDQVLHRAALLRDGGEVT